MMNMSETELRAFFLNTHNAASLYEAFIAEEARRLTDRLEIHYTPKHGNWLDIAEIELQSSHFCAEEVLLGITTFLDTVP
jgi:hypothetical protein